MAVGLECCSHLTGAEIGHECLHGKFDHLEIGIIILSSRIPAALERDSSTAGSDFHISIGYARTHRDASVKSHAGNVEILGGLLAQDIVFNGVDIDHITRQGNVAGKPFNVGKVADISFAVDCDTSVDGELQAVDVEAPHSAADSGVEADTVTRGKRHKIRHERREHHAHVGHTYSATCIKTQRQRRIVHEIAHAHKHVDIEIRGLCKEMETVEIHRSRVESECSFSIEPDTASLRALQFQRQPQSRGPVIKTVDSQVERIDGYISEIKPRHRLMSSRGVEGSGTAESNRIDLDRPRLRRSRVNGLHHRCRCHRRLVGGYIGSREPPPAEASEPDELRPEVYEPVGQPAVGYSRAERVYCRQKPHVVCEVVEREISQLYAHLRGIGRLGHCGGGVGRNDHCDCRTVDHAALYADSHILECHTHRFQSQLARHHSHIHG